MEKAEALRHLEDVISGYKNNYAPQNITVYQYWARVVRVVDGDTLELEIELGFDLKIRNSLRLIGLNTPETYGVKKGSEEYRKGMEAKEFVQNFVRENDWVEVEIYRGKKEKYGRWLGQVYKNGESLNVTLLTEELAEKL
ncbi:MAG: thermonuclease family protein [Bacteroidetes bacterium]|nr:MAG: thermonuclease family protein [Bacteroidota bacterium]